MKKQLATLLILFNCTYLYAQMDVDDADSLNFESFHKEKEGAIKLWENSDQNRQTKTPSQDKHQLEENSSSASLKTLTANTAQHFEVRGKYALAQISAPNTLYHVTEDLYQQMAQSCPQGWQKVSEKSVRSNDDNEGVYNLHIEFICL